MLWAPGKVAELEAFLVHEEGHHLLTRGLRPTQLPCLEPPSPLPWLQGGRGPQAVVSSAGWGGGRAGFLFWEAQVPTPLALCGSLRDLPGHACWDAVGRCRARALLGWGSIRPCLLLLVKEPPWPLLSFPTDRYHLEWPGLAVPQDGPGVAVGALPGSPWEGCERQGTQGTLRLPGVFLMASHNWLSSAAFLLSLPPLLVLISTFHAKVAKGPLTNSLKCPACWQASPSPGRDSEPA